MPGPDERDVLHDHDRAGALPGRRVNGHGLLARRRARWSFLGLVAQRLSAGCPGRLVYPDRAEICLRLFLSRFRGRRRSLSVAGRGLHPGGPTRPSVNTPFTWAWWFRRISPRPLEGGPCGSSTTRAFSRCAQLLSVPTHQPAQGDSTPGQLVAVVRYQLHGRVRSRPGRGERPGFDRAAAALDAYRRRSRASSTNRERDGDAADVVASRCKPWRLNGMAHNAPGGGPGTRWTRSGGATGVRAPKPDRDIGGRDDEVPAWRVLTLRRQRSSGSACHVRDRGGNATAEADT